MWLAGLIETPGRPGKATRLMVGLIYLKHSYNLSDEQVCERWLGNPVLAVLLWFRLPAASAAD
jgi:IS5 family transposase